jgi:carbonic anhydrase
MKTFLENVQYTMVPVYPDIIESLPGDDQQVLWVGCIDSDTIETDCVNVPRREMLVVRNLGNLLSNGDASSLAPLEWSVGRVIQVLIFRFQGIQSLMGRSLRYTTLSYAGITAVA